MRSPEPSQLVLHQTRPEQRLEVRRWLLDASAPPHLVVSASTPPQRWEDGDPAAEVLFEAFRGDRFVGAMLARLLSAGIVEVVPPRLAEAEPAATARQLIKCLHRSQGLLNARLLFTYTPTEGSDMAGCFQAAGYGRASDLLIMSRDLWQWSPPSTDRELELEPYCESLPGEFASLIESTYVGTQDYPELNAWFRAEDALAVYRRTAEADCRFWFLLRYGSESIGCLLLANQPQEGKCELSYMGVVPTARSLGWGSRMLDQAMRMARQWGSRHMVLGVDSANDLAIGLYSRAGFVQAERRALLWRQA